MDNTLEFTDIAEYLDSLNKEEKQKWLKDFHNQDLYYKGFVCKAEPIYNDGYDAPYTGHIYLNGESIGLDVQGEVPYQYVRDFWRTVEYYLWTKNNENTSA